MKKTALILMLLFCSIAWAGTYSGGAGTATDPYRISTVADYKELVATSADWAAGKCFKQTANLDFAADHTQNGDVGQIGAFAGTYDGQGFTISNINVATATDSVNSNGMITVTTATTILKNITVVGAVINGSCPNASNQSYAAVLVAQNAFGSQIVNCNINGTVTHTHITTSYGIFGIVAGANHGIVRNCIASGTVTAKSTAGNVIHVGGLVGYQTGKTDGSGNVSGTYNSISTATISIADQTLAGTSVYIGGIAGDVQKSSGTGNVNEIDGCRFYGTINVNWTASNGGGAYIGGITGYMTSKLSNSCAIASITVVSAQTVQLDVGGAVGDIVSGATVTTDCFADCDISVNYNTKARIAGFAGYINADVSNCYAKGSLFDAKENSTALNFINGGGFGGRITGATVTNCWCATDSFSAKVGNSSVLGFSGTLGTNTMTACFWDKTTSGMTSSDSTGITGKTTAQMKTQSTFVGYSFRPTQGYKWSILGNNYPKLYWEYNPYTRGRERYEGGYRGRYLN